jgi:hypothetical protein
LFFYQYLVRSADWEGIMFSQIFYRLTHSLGFHNLSRDEAYLSSAVDLGQLEHRVLALDHGLEI